MDSGVGQTYWQVILGRVIGGCGASGIISLASIIITGKNRLLLHNQVLAGANSNFKTDIAAPSDVAVLRSYVNVAVTVGLSLGGPLGGFLSESIGWRW